MEGTGGYSNAKVRKKDYKENKIIEKQHRNFKMNSFLHKNDSGFIHELAYIKPIKRTQNKDYCFPKITYFAHQIIYIFKGGSIFLF